MANNSTETDVSKPKKKKRIFYKTHVLIVEDELPFHHIVREYFNTPKHRIKYKFYFAKNGREALRTVFEMQRERGIVPDLVVTDLVMPGSDFDGWSVIEALRRNRIDCGIIIITATARGLGQQAVSPRITNSLLEGMRWNVFDFLAKPFSLEEFEEALNNYRKATQMRSRGFWDCQEQNGTNYLIRHWTDNLGRQYGVCLGPIKPEDERFLTAVPQKSAAESPDSVEATQSKKRKGYWFYRP